MSITRVAITNITTKKSMASRIHMATDEHHKHHDHGDHNHRRRTITTIPRPSPRLFSRMETRPARASRRSLRTAGSAEYDPFRRTAARHVSRMGSCLARNALRL